MPPWVYTYVAVGVATVWFAANAAAIIAQGTVVQDLSFNAVMGAVVGFLFGAPTLISTRAKRRDRDEHRSDPDR